MIIAGMPVHVRTGAREEVANLPWLPKSMLSIWTRWQAWEQWPPIVAESNGEVIGVILRRVTRKGLALDWIVVRPENRGHGVGRLMLRRIIKDAEERGARRIYLRCKAASPAEHFWRKYLQAEPVEPVNGDVRFNVEIGEAHR